MFHTDLRAAPGRTVHDDALYRTGGIFSLLFVEGTAVAIGAARGALDIYEETLQTRKTTVLPLMPMKDHPDYHRFYGETLQRIDVTEAALLSTTRDYTDWAQELEQGTCHVRTRATAGSTTAALLQARFRRVDLMVRTGASSALKPGAPMERYRRDITMISTHNIVQSELAASSFGRFHFGALLQPPGPSSRPLPPRGPERARKSRPAPPVSSGARGCS